MTKTAIVKGVARWYGKNVVPMIPAFSLTKAGHMAAVIMAEKNPSLAEAFLMNVVPPGVGAMLQTIVSAAQDDAVFDLAMKSLRDAVANEPGMGVRAGIGRARSARRRRRRLRWRRSRRGTCRRAGGAPRRRGGPARA